MNPLKIIENNFPTLNDAQKAAIKLTDGPVQIIAGPGSGKTFILALRTIYILLSSKAEPKEIIVTTFTEKAAFELRDRINQIARKIDYNKQLNELRISTIHGICNFFINQFRHRTSLNNNYEVLDELTQYLFLYDHFDEIVEIGQNGRYLNKWKTKWSTINGLIPFINKITEEIIDHIKLSSDNDDFLKFLSKTYNKYQNVLFENNKIDFPHQQKIFLDLLSNQEIEEKIKGNIKYILVDEYQDTNYIQEQIILRLGKPENNICIVGDEDQSLYRFRGATVRNILEFHTHFNNCKQITLSTNYRSHKDIIEKYNRFMNSIDWSNPNGKIPFRFQKEIKHNPDDKFPIYPAIFCIWGTNEDDEACRFAEMIKYLKDKNIIEDYNQTALLLKSVQSEHSKYYIEALNKKNIPVYAPRAKGYFDNQEVQLMFGCYAIIFGFHSNFLKGLSHSFSDLVSYTENSIISLAKEIQVNQNLQNYIQKKVKQIESLQSCDSLDLQIADYLYQLLPFVPFSKFLENENRARNLAIFSQLITIFQNYYHITIVTYKNREWIKSYLFLSFFKFLIGGGINEYEDPDNPIPKGYVQIMTVHQAKGLEFPVIVVGSLDKNFKVQKQVDRYLSPFYHRPPFEPESRITEFDRMRHFYVAFSRSEKILVLTTTNKPKEYLFPMWDGLEQWPYVETKVLESLKFKAKPQFIPKKSYSLSSHINVYEICPKQYELYKEYEFSPSRSATMLFGTLVHQTIEDIHRWVLDGRLSKIDDNKINDLFERNYRSLLASGMRPLSKNRKDLALNQIVNYYFQNYSELNRVIDTEVDVSVEKDSYILSGKIDLLLGKDKKLEVLDFKAQQKPEKNDPILDRYFKQLCIYAHILEERYNKHPERLYIYWTAEKKRKDALTEFSFSNTDIDKAGKYFDSVVNEIQKKNFTINKPPDETKICKECDFRTYCSAQGIIKMKIS